MPTRHDRVGGADDGKAALPGRALSLGGSKGKPASDVGRLDTYELATQRIHHLAKK